MSRDPQVEQLHTLFLLGIADAAPSAGGAANAYVVGRQLGLSRDATDALVDDLDAAGLVHSDRAAGTVALTPLGQRRLRPG